jgi:hypothetical protein
MSSPTPRSPAALAAGTVSPGVAAVARPSLRAADAVALVVRTGVGGELFHLFRGSPPHPWTATGRVPR